MKNYSFLKEYFVPMVMDVSNAGGIIGAAAGGATPLALSYLYFKLIKQPKWKRELRYAIDMLSPKQLDDQIMWVIHVYSNLLNSNRITSFKIIENVNELLNRGKKIISSKDTPPEIKKQFLYDITFKYRLVSKISYGTLSKYGNNSGGSGLGMLIATCVGASLGSFIGADMAR